MRHEQASRLQVGLWRCSLNPSLDFEGMLGLEASAAAVVRLGCCRERRFAFRIQSALQAQRRLSSGPLISAEESRTCSVVAKWEHERQPLSIGRFLLSLLPRSGNAGSCAQTDRQHRRVEALGLGSPVCDVVAHFIGALASPPLAATGARAARVRIAFR